MTETVNRLYRAGGGGDRGDNVHVSGHGRRRAFDDVAAGAPRNFVPVHGEFRMLQAHAHEAAACRRMHADREQDGTILELDGDGLSGDR